MIEFSTFNYSDAGLSKFAYKLEGYDDTWSAPSSLNFAAYKNLPPGSYHLHVKARNTVGTWSDESVLKIHSCSSILENDMGNADLCAIEYSCFICGLSNNIEDEYST